MDEPPGIPKRRGRPPKPGGRAPRPRRTPAPPVESIVLWHARVEWACAVPLPVMTERQQMIFGEAVCQLAKDKEVATVVRDMLLLLL